MAKQRLDLLVVELGFAQTQEAAQALILGGRVLVNDSPIDKAGTRVAADASIRIRGSASPYVGRGGEKISHAFDLFQVELSGIVALDVGASTGGFTDCMLQRGAARVYAVDVGYNQLAHSLRVDPRVVVMEQTHAASLQPSRFDPPPSFAAVDVSFISSRTILAPVAAVLAPGGAAVVLVKPQFELPRGLVSEGGVVPNPQDQSHAVQLVADYSRQIGMIVRGTCASPLRGLRKGNQEYFLYLAKS